MAKWQFEAMGYVEAKTREEAWKKARELRVFGEYHIENPLITITSVGLKPDTEA